MGRMKFLRRFVSSLFAILLLSSILSEVIILVPWNSLGTDVQQGHISSNTTWTKAQSPYRILGDVVVDYGSTLTVEPGVEVWFTGAFNLYVDGNLTAQGTQDNHITFKSAAPSGKPGDWMSIRINGSGRLNMNFADILHATHALDIFNCIYARIENSTVSLSKSHGLYARYSSNIVVYKSDFANNGLNGIYFYSSSQGAVISTKSHSNTYEGLALYESSHFNVTGFESYSNDASGINMFSCSNVSVEDSDIHDNMNSGIIVKSSENIDLFQGNVFSNGEDGIYVPDSVGIVMDFLTLYDHNNSLYIFNSSNIILRNSNISQNTGSGITLLDSSQNTLQNLRIYQSGNYGILMTRDPIDKKGSSSNTIDNTNISDCTYGIMMRFSKDNKINGGVIYSNVNGLISQECTNTSVNNTNVSGNDYYAISFIGSSGGRITNNRLFDNFYGIFLLAPSSNNIIHHNTVTLHSYHAFSASQTNQWDDGAQGNYWGDYDGIDSDLNGIGDEPYPISSAGEDRFPLVDFNNTRFKIISSLPANGTSHVPVSTTIKLFFSEGAIKGTVVGNISISPATNILSYLWEDNNKTLTCTVPTLSSGKYYALTVKTNATGISGRSLQKPHELVFYTDDPSDTTPPKVVSVYPTGSTVPINLSSINITFNEVMHRAATESAFSIDPWLPGYFSWQNNTLRFFPTLELSDLTTYTVRLDANQAKDATDHLLDGDGDGSSEGSPADDYTWEFSTYQSDFIPPYILGVEPTGDLVGITSPIRIYFSELVNKTSVEAAFSYTNQTVTWTSVNGTWGRSAFVMTFIPDTPFNYSENYQVTLSASVKDLYGNTLDGNGNGTSEGSPTDDFIWTFRTAPAPALGLPTINKVSPTGFEVDIDSTISINFSQEMNQESVEAAFFVSDGISQWNKSHGVFWWQENESVFVPTFMMEYNKTYTVTIRTDAKNIVGDQLDGNKNGIPENNTLDAYVWSFKTKSPSDLMISNVLVNGADANDPLKIWPASLGAIIQIGVNVTNVGFFSTNFGFNITLSNTSGEGIPMTLFVPALGQFQDSGTLSFQWSVPQGTGEYFVEIVADLENAIFELEEGNNSFVLHFAVGPDYTPVNITVNGLEASDPILVWEVDLGSAVIIQVHSKNVGFSGVATQLNYTIAFFNSTAAGAPLEVPFQVVSGLPGLAVGSSSSVSLASWLISNSDSDFYVTIFVDYTDTTIELDEGNNIFVLHFVFSPDYAVKSVRVNGEGADDPQSYWNATAHELLEISLNITNLGPSGIADAVYYNVSFFNSTSRGTPLGAPFYSIELPGLFVNEDSNEVFGFWLPPGLTGDYYVALIIDPLDEFHEENEKNNVFVLHFVVGCDIVVSRLWVKGQLISNSPSLPIYIGPNETADIAINVSNQGFSGTGGDFFIALYNSSKEGVMLEAPYLNLSVLALSPKGEVGFDSQNLSASWKAALAPGIYHVTVYADISDLCSESNENNNFWVLTFVISPDLVPANIAVDGLPISSYPNSTVFILPGGSLQIGAMVLNLGPGGTGADLFGMAFYNSTASGANLGGEFAQWLSLGPLAGGGSTLDHFATWTAPYPDSPSDYYINISVDCQFSVLETSEKNNHYILHIRVDGPDLTPRRIVVEGDFGVFTIIDDPYFNALTSEEISIPLGANLTIIFDAINVGGIGQVTGTNITFYNTTKLHGAPNGTPFFETPLQWILLSGRNSPASDETSEVGQTISAFWINPNIMGLWFINITIDPGNSLNEFNETNNTFTLIINVTDYPVSVLTAIAPSYYGAALYVNSSSLLSIGAFGGSPPLYTWYQITNLTGGSIVWDWTNHTLEGSPFRMTSGEGIFQIEFYSLDSIGQIENTKTRIVVVDDSKPQTGIVFGSPQYRKIPSHALNITSATPIYVTSFDLPNGTYSLPPISNYSGVKDIQYLIQNLTSGINVTAWIKTTSNTPIYLNDPAWGDGPYMIWIKSIDNLNQEDGPHPVNVYLDNTPPNTTISVGNPKRAHPTLNWFVTSFTKFTFLSNDANGSGSDPEGLSFKLTSIDDGISYDWTFAGSFDIDTYFVLKDGNYSIQARCSDYLGNTALSAIIYIYLDNSPPEVTLSVGDPKFREFSNEIWNVSQTTGINLTGDDGAGCQINNIQYRIFNATYDSGWGVYFSEFNLSGLDHGSYWIEYFGLDRLGNFFIYKTEVFLDLIPPVSAISVGEPKIRMAGVDLWNITSHTPFLLEFLYDNGSQPYFIQFRIMNASYDSDWLNYSQAVFINSSFADGVYTVLYRGLDHIYNIEVPQSVNIRLDNGGPLSNVTVVGNVFGQYVNFLASYVKNADDGEGSGVASTWHRIYGNDSKLYHTGWLSGPFFTLPANLIDGNYTIEIYAKDSLSNQGPTGFLTITLDNTPPSSTIEISEPRFRLRTNDPFRVSQDTSFSLLSNDKLGAGIKTIYYSIKNDNNIFLIYLQPYSGAFNLSGLGDDGGYTIIFHSVDNLDTSESEHSIRVILDSTPPKVILGSPTGLGNSPLSYIQVVFSEEVDHDSLALGFSIWDGTAYLDHNMGFFNWMGSTVRFYPDQKLKYDTNYTVTLNTSVTDFVGNFLDGDGDGIFEGPSDTYSWSFRTQIMQDKTPPHVVSAVPANGEKNVSVETPVIIKFSEVMDELSVEAAFSITDGIHVFTSESGTFHWSGNTTNFTLDSPFRFDTRYVVTLGAQARDIMGNFISLSYSFSFTTHKDNVPPNAIGFAPSGANALIGTRISITFDEPMNPGVPDEALIIVPGINGTLAWEGNTLTFTPQSNLEFVTEYFVTVGIELSDIHGNHLVLPFTFSFTTESDTYAPFVVSTSPSGTEVDIHSNISVTFNEEMDHESVEQAFLISTTVAGSFVWDENTLIFVPTELAPKTIYLITIGTGASDIKGNFLSASYQFSFTTKSDPYPPYIVEVTPSGSEVPITSKIVIRFNEPVNLTSLSGALVINPHIPGTVSVSGDSMVFTPNGNLLRGTVYNITVLKKVKDMGGNSLSSDYSWEFETETVKTTTSSPFPWDLVLFWIFIAVIAFIVIISIYEFIIKKGLKKGAVEEGGIEEAGSKAEEEQPEEEGDFIDELMESLKSEETDSENEPK